jgi:hypothetical protein
VLICTVTFIKIADLKDNTIIPKSGDKNLGLEYALFVYDLSILRK